MRVVLLRFSVRVCLKNCWCGLCCCLSKCRVCPAIVAKPRRVLFTHAKSAHLMLRRIPPKQMIHIAFLSFLGPAQKTRIHTMTRAPRMCDAAPHSCLCSLLAPRFLGCESLVEGKPENLSLEIRPAFEDHHATQKRSSKSDALFGTFMPRRRATSHTTCAFVCVSVATQYNPTKKKQQPKDVN